MKCVCPMGGDRECPDNCDYVRWSNLSAAEKKAQRKSFAEKDYKAGYTMEQIATKLGVSVQTISTDLQEFSSNLKTQSRISKRGRKGEGRPKGSKSQPKPKSSRRGEALKFKKARELVRPNIEADKPLNLDELAQSSEPPMSRDTLERAALAEQARKEALAEARANPNINREELSLSAQQKLDLAIRQHQKKLNLAFEQRVLDEIRRRMDEIVLPSWKKRIDEANKLYSKRRGLMDKDTFNTIRRALHPDSRNAISDKKLGEAFNTFMGLEKYLLNEKDSPTRFGEELPTSLAEWDKARAAASAERKARRTLNPLRHQ